MTAIWNENLITRERAANMCGTWPVKLDNADYDKAFLRCQDCDGNIMQLPTAGRVTSIDGLIAAVLRHMCSSHDYKLSGAGNEDKGSDGAATDGAGGGGGGRRAGDLVR